MFRQSSLLSRSENMFSILVRKITQDPDPLKHGACCHEHVKILHRLDVDKSEREGTLSELKAAAKGKSRTSNTHLPRISSLTSVFSHQILMMDLTGS